MGPLFKNLKSGPKLKAKNQDTPKGPTGNTDAHVLRVPRIWGPQILAFWSGLDYSFRHALELKAKTAGEGGCPSTTDPGMPWDTESGQA